MGRHQRFRSSHLWRWPHHWYRLCSASLSAAHSFLGKECKWQDLRLLMVRSTMADRAIYSTSTQLWVVGQCNWMAHRRRSVLSGWTAWSRCPLRLWRAIWSWLRCPLKLWKAPLSDDDARWHTQTRAPKATVSRFEALREARVRKGTLSDGDARR